MTFGNRRRFRPFAASFATAILWPATSLAEGPADGVSDPAKNVAAPPVNEPAQAPPKPLVETLSGQAAQEYQAGLLLYGSGDYHGARRSFSSAYELSGDVRLLWNAAACEQALRRYSKAIVLVRRYLASSSPLITPEAEKKARDFLEAALPLTAPFRIESEPGAAVYLDDELVGTLPLDPEMRIDVGSHKLVLKKKRFVDATKSFAVTAPKDVAITLGLVPEVERGKLVVRASDGDSISLDGRFVGLGRFEGDLVAGSHQLKVVAEGARPFESRVFIEPDKARFMEVKLERTDRTGLPTWVWVAGGAALVAGAGTAGYFLFKSSDEAETAAPTGSMGNVKLPLRW
jgi:hypothetical protein